MHEGGWTCPACGVPQRAPWPVVLVVDDDTTWAAVRTATELECSRCGGRQVQPEPTVLIDRPDAAYAIAVRPGHPASAPPEFLPPGLRRRVDPIDWPGDEGRVLDHPVVRQTLLNRARLVRLQGAVGALIALPNAPAVLKHAAEHPDLGTPDAVTVLDETLAVAGFPPEGERYRAAFLALFAAIAAGPDEAAAERFLAEREDGQRVIGEAGLRQREWLAEHIGDRDTDRWDTVARSTFILLGFGGLAADRAATLFMVGSQVDARATKSPEDIDWAIDCLRESRELAVELGIQEGAAASAENLAIALQSRRHGNLRADTEEAVDLFSGVLRYRTEQGDAASWAHTATSLANTLVRLSELQADHTLAPRAVALCREALPARPRETDPEGWSFSSVTLANALIRDDSSEQPLSDRLTEAIGIFREVWPVFATRGAIMGAHKIKIDLCRALTQLAGLRRDDLFRRQISDMLGHDAGSAEVRAFRLMERAPQMYGLSDFPPELTELFRGPPAPDERAPLIEALSLAEAGVAETRLTGDVERCGEYARIVAVTTQHLEPDSEATVRTLTAMRALIDHRSTPNGAWATTADLGDLHMVRGEWAAARQAYDDCLAIRDWVLGQIRDREMTLLHLRRSPAIVRAAAYSRVRCGDAEGAVELLERSRLRSYAEVSGDVTTGSGALLRSTSATVAEVGHVATPACPIAYVVTTAAGSVVLLVRRDEAGTVTVDSYDVDLTSGHFFVLFQNVLEPELGLMSAQREGRSPATAVARMAGPLGQVLQPVVDALHRDGIERLLLVPTGPTSAYPWAAADVTHPATGATVPVVDLLVLAQAPSALTAGFCRRRAAQVRPGRVTIFADPQRPDAAPLPGARTEALGVAAAFPGRATVHLGADATREALLAELPHSWLTHLACHGTNDWVEFEAMRLLLSNGDVTLDDLRELPFLQSRLVFLSACQTGHADVDRLSDEMIGLPYALLAGGAAAVVSTLWPIDDQVTARLVERFYAELAGLSEDGEQDDIPLALQRAQQWLRTTTRDERGPNRDLSGAEDTAADPYHWAAFVCHGV